jgi:outer membrane receptor protein involved in Fe transport
VLATYVVSSGRGRTGDTRLRFSAGKGIKAPSLVETYSPNPFFEGNPDLEPERSWSVDAGVEQRLLRDRLRVDAVYFETRNRDQISTATTDLVTFFSRYFNLGSTQARGVELTIDAAPASRVHARGGYSLVASEILEAAVPDGTIPPFSPFVAGRWALRRPRHSGFVEAAVTEGRLSLSLLGTFVGRRTDSDFGSFTPALTELPGYAVWRIGARYALPRYVDVTFDVDNLTNADYMEPMGYLTLDRTFRVGARVRF